jgi:hypothetical protein
MLLRITMLLSLAAFLGAQSPPPKTSNPSPIPPLRTVNPVAGQEKDELPMTSPIKMLKYQHEEVKKDVDKLVKLVGEVQDEVDKAGENVLPLNTLKKLEEVEKLTKKVRNRIKQ